jgi:hypothetical protein
MHVLCVTVESWAPVVEYDWDARLYLVSTLALGKHVYVQVPLTGRVRGQEAMCVHRPALAWRGIPALV